MSYINLKVITPGGTPYEGKIKQVSICTTIGYVTILPHHFPLISTIVPSVLIIKEEGDKKIICAVASGILKVNDNETQILVSSFEKNTDIDVERAKRAKQRAEERLASKESYIDQERAELALKKSIARIKASQFK